MWLGSQVIQICPLSPYSSVSLLVFSTSLSWSCRSNPWWPCFSKVLKERIERVKAKKNDAFTSRSEFTEEMLEIRKDFVIIHGEMILLQTYSSLNFAGEHLKLSWQSAVFV